MKIKVALFIGFVLITSSVVIAEKESLQGKFTIKTEQLLGWTSLPAQSIGEDLMMNLPSIEPSGLAYDNTRSQLWVVGDEGNVASLDTTGEFIQSWDTGKDLEAVTLDEAGDVFFADEKGTSILKFDMNTGEVSELCQLSDLPIDSADNKGLEGLVWIPEVGSPLSWGAASDGYWIAGSQYTKDLYVYSADQCIDGASVTSLAKITTAYDDVSDLAYSKDTKNLYVLNDDDNKLQIIGLAADGTTLLRKDNLLTDGDEEGLAIMVPVCGLTTSKAKLVIADDKDGTLFIYERSVHCKD